jgi:hypothetical protein
LFEEKSEFRHCENELTGIRNSMQNKNTIAENEFTFAVIIFKEIKFKDDIYIVSLLRHHYLKMVASIIIQIICPTDL